MLLGPLLDRLATLFRPLIWLLSTSTNLVLRLLRADPTASGDQISGDELRELVMSHEGLSDQERRIVRDVFAAGNRHIREAMRPRTDVDFLDAVLPVSHAARLAWEHTHTRYPWPRVTQLGRMPTVGDSVEVAEHRLAVVAIEGWRVDRLLVTPVEPPGAGVIRAPSAPIMLKWTSPGPGQRAFQHDRRGPTHRAAVRSPRCPAGVRRQWPRPATGDHLQCRPRTARRRWRPPDRTRRIGRGTH